MALGHAFHQTGIVPCPPEAAHQAHLEDLVVVGEGLQLQRAGAAVVEGPGAAHVEPGVSRLGEGGGDRGARGGVGGEVHEPVGVEAVDDEGLPRPQQVRAPALDHCPLVGVRRHDGDAGGEEDTTEEGHARRC